MAAALHELRVIGNFAAHPMKSPRTGKVIEVELGEAEQCLQTLDAIFDHYYVAPGQAKQRRDRDNQKLLLEAGKVPLPQLPE